MSGSFAMRSSFVALLIAFSASVGCTAATKTPIPAPANDSSACPDAGKTDCRLCGWLLLGNAIGLRTGKRRA